MQNNSILDLSIPQAVRKIGLPVAVGFFFHTMFNVVDNFFAGFLGTDALAALAASFPIFFIIIAFSSGVGTGMNTLLAGLVAQKNQERVDRKFAQGVFFGVCVAFILFFIGLFFLQDTLKIQGVQDSFYAGTKDYLQVTFNYSFVFVAFSILNGTLLAYGDSKPFQKVLIVGFFANIVLNYLFINVFNWGVKGLAASTVMIEGSQALYLLIYLLHKKYLSEFQLHQFRPNWNCFRDFLHHGGLATLNLLIIGCGLFYILSFVNVFGANATAAYGISLRVEQILILPSLALGMATQTLVGQNLGIGNKEQAVNSLFATYRYALVMGAISAITLLLFADYLIAIFSSDPEVIEIGAYYLRITGFIHLAYNLMGITSHFFYAIKRPLVATITTFSRSIVLPLICFGLATEAFGLHGVWWSIFIINNFVCLLVVTYTLNLAKELKA